MTDTKLARARPFGTLPAATSGLKVEQAIELAGVDLTELALLASTTFKEARTLEELVTLVSTTRRRGLDGLSRHVYYEHFGGQNNDPSLHVAIDGLRAIAAATGCYGGSSEPRFSGGWDMPMDDSAKPRLKQVPEQCSITVWRIVQGRSCAFEGMAWMEEAYPGAGGRGKMWRERPRGMLAIAAERQALRRAFPSETSGIGDVDEGELTEDVPPRTQAELVAEYQRINPPDPPELQAPLITVRSPLGQRLAELVEEAARLDVEYADCQVSLPAPREAVIRAGERLKDRIESKKAELARPPAEEEEEAALR